MSDPLDEALAAFDQQLGIEPETPAETAAPDEGAGPVEAPEVAEQPEDRPRDDQGRFVAITDEGETFDVTPDGIKPTVDEKFSSYLSRFGLDPDAYAALPEQAQKALKSGAELDSEFGRRNQDWAELKQLREEFSGYREQEQLRQQELQQQLEQREYAAQAPPLVEQMLDRGDYYQAAELARQANNGVLYGQVMSQWAVDDSFQANSYHAALVAQAQDARVQRMLDERLAPVQTLAQQSEQQQQQRLLGEAFDEFAKGRPDIQAVGPKMLEVAQESPRVLAVLQENDPQATREVLDYLYTKAQQRVGTSLADAKVRVEGEQRAAERTAKDQAFVGAGSTRVEPETKPPDEQWLDQVFAEHARRIGYVTD